MTLDDAVAFLRKLVAAGALVRTLRDPVTVLLAEVDPARPRAWRDRDGDVWIPREDGTYWLLSDSAVPDRAALERDYGPLVELGAGGVLPDPPGPPFVFRGEDGREYRSDYGVPSAATPSTHDRQET